MNILIGYDNYTHVNKEAVDRYSRVIACFAEVSSK